MTDNIYDQAQVGQEFGLDVATFDRVEIIRGPASALYGTNAFFAVVNIITRPGASLDGFRASIEGDSLHERAVRLAFGRRFDSGTDVAVSGRFGQSDGVESLSFPDLGSLDGGVARGLDEERSAQFFGRVTLPSLALRGGYGYREKQVPTAAYDTLFGDPRFRTTDEHLFIDAQHERPAGAAHLSLRTYLDWYRYDGAYPYEGWEGTPDVVLFRDYADGVWWGVEGRATRDIGARQTMTIGAEVRHNARQNQGGSYDGDYAEGFTIAASSYAFGAFAQDEIRLGSHVRLTLGGRYDAYEGARRLSPRAALIVNTSANQAFKYLYGSAFRAPNAYESDYYSGGVGDSALEPETTSSHELVWERYLGNWLRTSLSAYRTDVDRLITFIGDENTVDEYAFINLGHVDARGVEAEAEVRLTSGLLAAGHYVWQEAHDVESGSHLTNSPRHAGGLRLGVSGPWQSLWSTELQALGPRRTLAGTEVRSSVVSHLTVLVPLGSAVRLQAGVRNMFDRDNADPGSEEHRQVVIPQNGRTWRIGLDWSFR
jgi:iron complex outermembrane receptor protein